MSLPMPSYSEPRPTPLTGSDKITLKGRFFFKQEEKFFIKGVTYGPFSPSSRGGPFPEPAVVEADLALMVELGANCFRIFTPPPQWLLDTAAAYGLRTIVGIPWAEHLCFLDSASLQAEIRQTIARAVNDCKDHPAVLAYLVGNEVPPEIVRWYGARRVRAFLSELADIAKSIDPAALVSYANFPSTEYLETDFADFLSFNVYLHNEKDFRRYLSHLHILAGDRPLVLTEIGIDSIREGRSAQAKTLSWQVRAAFETGAAGTVIFSWTDDWYAFPLSGSGGFQVNDWAFGLVDRERRRKPAFWAVKNCYDGPLPPRLPHYPKVSVIVCAYNAERTLEPCLASLEKLRYPNYEVIVVNDGSTDATRQIAERHPSVRLINQENRGLSAARNVGLRASTGVLIAYTDSDCVADPDWLAYMVARFLSTDFAAVGGPNLSPPDDSLVASSVAVSPGAPTHVLLDDEIAEHIPGCNMAFRREALEAIGGFDPIFRAAGDDVDLCWRLQNQGYSIGFSPAAVVWHFRRNTVRDYLKQQRGYGKAETLLYFKHPYRFNVLGQSRWFGRIYGDISSFLLRRQPRIYSGAFGRGLFQTLYEPPPSLISYLPLTLEWNAIALALAASALLLGGPFWLGLLPLGIALGRCFASAAGARLPPQHAGWKATLLVALLVYLGPLARTFERYRWRIRRLRELTPVTPNGPTQPPRISWRERAFYLGYWNEEGREKESLLHGIMESLLPRKYLIAIDQGWSDWDLEICQSPWAKAQIKTATENHAGQKRLVRVRCSLRMSRISVAFLAAYLLAAALAALFAGWHVSLAVGGAGLVHAIGIVHQKFHLARAVYHNVESVAHRLGFLPLEKSLQPLTQG
ncbi:MAG TPA: glycosyltransferase [Candidatus Acidoferrales bacterium]|nr:glycosyltransferase [Candidatus Acidoferrales bacterium]